MINRLVLNGPSDMMDTDSDSDNRDPDSKFNTERGKKQMEDNSTSSGTESSSGSTSSSESNSGSGSDNTVNDEENIYSNPTPSGSGTQSVEAIPISSELPIQKSNLGNNEKKEAKRNPENMKLPTVERSSEKSKRRYFKPSPFDCYRRHVDCKNPLRCKIEWEKTVRVNMLTRKVKRNDKLTNEEKRFIRLEKIPVFPKETNKSAKTPIAEKTSETENKPKRTKKKSLMELLTKKVTEKKQDIKMQRLVRRMCRKYYYGKKDKYNANKVIKAEIDLTEESAINIETPITTHLESVTVNAPLEDIVVNVPFSIKLPKQTQEIIKTPHL